MTNTIDDINSERALDEPEARKFKLTTYQKRMEELRDRMESIEKIFRKNIKYHTDYDKEKIYGLLEHVKEGRFHSPKQTILLFNIIEKGMKRKERDKKALDYFS